MYDDETIARFWAKVDRREPDDCWEWLAAKGSSGYGRFHLTGRKWIVATRIAWELANSKNWPVGLLALHTCDNRSCVNPAHIWPGTNQENQDDCLAKGRRKTGPTSLLCARGHKRKPGKTGRYYCPTCHAAYRNAHRLKQRARAALNAGGDRG